MSYPINNVEFTKQLATKLGETEPRKQFYLWSAICLIGRNESLKMIERAEIMYKFDKTHTLGGFWYMQLPPKSDRAMYRIRQGIRQFMNLEPHSVPDCFR